MAWVWVHHVHWGDKEGCCRIDYLIVSLCQAKCADDCFLEWHVDSHAAARFLWSLELSKAIKVVTVNSMHSKCSLAFSDAKGSWGQLPFQHYLIQQNVREKKGKVSFSYYSLHVSKMAGSYLTLWHHRLSPWCVLQPWQVQRKGDHDTTQRMYFCQNFWKDRHLSWVFKAVEELEQWRSAKELLWTDWMIFFYTAGNQSGRNRSEFESYNRDRETVKEKEGDSKSQPGNCWLLDIPTGKGNQVTFLSEDEIASLASMACGLTQVDQLSSRFYACAFTLCPGLSAWDKV